MWAAQQNKAESVIELLKHEGIDVNTTNIFI